MEALVKNNNNHIRHKFLKTSVPFVNFNKILFSLSLQSSRSYVQTSVGYLHATTISQHKMHGLCYIHSNQSRETYKQKSIPTLRKNYVHDMHIIRIYRNLTILNASWKTLSVRSCFSDVDELVSNINKLFIKSIRWKF